MNVLNIRLKLDGMSYVVDLAAGMGDKTAPIEMRLILLQRLVAFGRWHCYHDNNGIPSSAT